VRWIVGNEKVLVRMGWDSVNSKEGGGTHSHDLIILRSPLSAPPWHSRLNFLLSLGRRRGLHFAIDNLVCYQFRRLRVRYLLQGI